MNPARHILLLDNGSLEPAATLSLRRLAKGLGGALGREVLPVSLLHSHKVPAEALGGEAAEILEPALKRRLAAGQNGFDVVPLFFGLSGALTEYLPARLEVLRKTWPQLDLRVAPCLAEPEGGEGVEGGGVLLDILEEHVAGCLDGTGAQRVILVDHGSPRVEVTEVRDRLARQLAQRLAGRVGGVAAASMERRPEPEYDFNEPLLERALRGLPEGACEVVLAMLFVSPGRHAGPGGDIVQICEAACAERAGLSVRMTALVGESPRLIPLLVRRLGSLD